MRVVLLPIYYKNENRIETFPSPMQLNFGGEKAYFLEMGKQASLNNVYEIFDQDKPNLNCVSVAEQKQFYDDWFTSLVGGTN